MIAQTMTCRYTESLSKTKAVIPPRQSAAFFVPVYRQSYPSLVGVENSHTIPARGKLYAASFVPRVRPTARIVGGLSQKTKEVSMANQSIATSVAPVIDIPFLKIPQFPAAITSEQIDTIEKTLAEHNRTRRLMLLFLSLDSRTFIEKAKAIMDGDEDIYMEAIEALDDYQKKLKSLSELANSAFARFLWVGEYVSRKGA